MGDIIVFRPGSGLEIKHPKQKRSTLTQQDKNDIKKIGAFSYKNDIKCLPSKNKHFINFINQFDYDYQMYDIMVICFWEGYKNAKVRND